MLPKVPKGFVTNFPNAVPDFIGPRQFIFLLSVVSVLILTSFFLITSQNPFQKSQNPQYFSSIDQMRKDAETIKFSSSLWKKRFSENLDVAAKETDPQKQFEALSANFPILMGIYNTSHDSKVRIQAEHLAQFIQQEFADQAQNQNFTVPCLDLDCGQPNYPPEITEIIEQLQDNKSINTEVRDSVLNKIQAAAISTNSNFQWQYNLEAFQAIVGEKERTGDERLVKIAQDLRDFLKSNYPENYSDLEKTLPNVLTI